MKNRPKVLMGMSGGVDSSVAATLLVEQGYDVIGAFMKNWEGDKCEWAQDSNDALMICQDLGIPFKVIDFQDEYRDLIISYLVKEYKAGRTPNPDVYCNRLVKFGVFWEAFKGMDIDYIATGHYALTDNHFLYKGIDSSKDQSYFLSNVSKEQISRMILPLGGFMKSEVRDKAKEYGLHTHNKKDSQGLCFIGKIPFQEFISRYIPDNPGLIRNADTMDIIGSHDGIHHHTVGQRRGLRINTEGPWYVSELSVDTNTVYVYHDLMKDSLKRSEFYVKDTVWHSDDRPYQMEVVIRYHDTPHLCTVDGDKVTLSDSKATIAPGQIAAFYLGDKLLGSGVIK
jgi:tRNA-specific 2-thiouridylase